MAHIIPPNIVNTIHTEFCPASNGIPNAARNSAKINHIFETARLYFCTSLTCICCEIVQNCTAFFDFHDTTPNNTKALHINSHIQNANILPSPFYFPALFRETFLNLFFLIFFQISNVPSYNVKS